MIRIAIAEDSAEEQSRLRRYLARYQQENDCAFDIQVYANGAEIVQAYRPGIDILLLDIEMPVMDGMRTARILRERDRNVVIVFVTNLAQYAVQGYEVEALDFIVKPLDWNVFSFRMTRILSRLKRRQDATAHSMVIRTDDGLRRVEGGRLPLGILERVQPARTRVALAPGDVLAMVSDGVWEALGQEGIAGLLERDAEDLNALSERLLEAAVMATPEGMRDDMTVICLGVRE